MSDPIVEILQLTDNICAEIEQALAPLETATGKCVLLSWLLGKKLCELDRDKRESCLGQVTDNISKGAQGQAPDEFPTLH
jgi:hypothetical protein